MRIPLEGEDLLLDWLWESVAWDLVDELHLVLWVSVEGVRVPLSLDARLAGDHLLGVVVKGGPAEGLVELLELAKHLLLAHLSEGLVLDEAVDVGGGHVRVVVPAHEHLQLQVLVPLHELHQLL